MARWPVSITPREAEVLKQMATGKMSAAIGVELGISKRTVDFHIMNLKRKSQHDTNPLFFFGQWHIHDFVIVDKRRGK
jgi:DNA-binding CsgD family transcriptional regulator